MRQDGAAVADGPDDAPARLTAEFFARFKSTLPASTRSTVEESFTSNRTRACGPILARLESANAMVAEESDVAISSPATSGKAEAAVAGTAFPFNVSGPEPVIFPSGSAARRTNADIITIARHTYFMAYLLNS